MNVRLATLSVLLLAGAAPAEICNLKVVTDASPDYADVDSLLYSATSRWPAPEEKCRALFTWSHIARRQTNPMHLHGLALTDPIMQFNDYGCTMCSTISGINCALWSALGLRAKYWDIANHTVPEVEYDGGWHMFDNSMSALYTLCDGRTLAGVADIGRTGACAASEGRVEKGHIARYHCLTATSPRGFLTGADTVRSLEEESRCFATNALKYRFYYYDWDGGHRWQLNLRDGEEYTRFYHSLGAGPEYFVPNNGKDPEAANPRYRIRGNGVRVYQPAALAGAYRVEGANVITSLKIEGAGAAAVSVSADNGRSWRAVDASRPVVDEVNGAYAVLVKADPPARLRFETTTMLNSKTQPQLRLGRNEVYVGAGEPAESIVLWPDLRGDRYRTLAVAESNLATAAEHPGYMGAMFAARPDEEASVVFRVDAPRALTGLTYGGRLYNRAPRAHIDFRHSFDGGRTWVQTYSLTNTAPPWDVIHVETVPAVPPGATSVLFKFAFTASAAGRDACSLYALRMEARHQPENAAPQPLAVTFTWGERQADYTLVERSHTEVVTHLPHRYVVNVGGADHPVVHALRVGPAGAASPGYSDGRDAGGETFVPRWRTCGRNLAQGRPYTLSVAPTDFGGSGDPDRVKLTDGVVGPDYAGGSAPASGASFDPKHAPDITVDLGAVERCGAFRIHMNSGWEWPDALQGQWKDEVELLTSQDGQSFASQGTFDLRLRWKDIPVNHMLPDDEMARGWNFEMIPPQPVAARYVRYHVVPRHILAISEVQVFDRITYTPHDLRIALPPAPPP